MKDNRVKSKSESSLSKGLESKPDQATVKSLKDIKSNILNRRKTWITIDGVNFVYVELRNGGSLWVNYGLDEEETTLKVGIKNIYNFLTFKRSTDLL